MSLFQESDNRDNVLIFMPFCRTRINVCTAEGFHRAGLLFGSGVSGFPAWRGGYQVKHQLEILRSFTRRQNRFGDISSYSPITLYQSEPNDALRQGSLKSDVFWNKDHWNRVFSGKISNCSCVTYVSSLASWANTVFECRIKKMQNVHRVPLFQLASGRRSAPGRVQDYVVARRLRPPHPPTRGLRRRPLHLRRGRLR